MEYNTIVNENTVAIFYFSKLEFDHGEAHEAVTRFVKESTSIADNWSETWGWDGPFSKWVVRIDAWDPHAGTYGDSSGLDDLLRNEEK